MVAFKKKKASVLLILPSVHVNVAAAWSFHRGTNLPKTKRIKNINNPWRPCGPELKFKYYMPGPWHQQPRRMCNWTENMIKEFGNIGTLAASLVAAFAIFTATPPANAIESSLVEGQIPPLNPAQRRYATVLSSGSPEEISAANEALLDHAVGTINTMYFDNTGGNKFDTKRMYSRWGALRAYAKGGESGLEKFKKAELRRIQREQADWIEINDGSLDGEESAKALLEDRLPPTELASMPPNAFSSREGAVNGLNWLVSTLKDPYSQYLTKEELFQELRASSDGFVGTGALVEAPQRVRRQDKDKMKQDQGPDKKSTERSIQSYQKKGKKTPALLSTAQVIDLPIVTAVTANSFAERDGIVVGDRIVSVGKDSFLGLGVDEVTRRLDSGRYDGIAASRDPRQQQRIIAIAKPVKTTDESTRQERIVGYRVSRINLKPSSRTIEVTDGSNIDSEENRSRVLVQGGDAIVQYKLIAPNDSIFQKGTDSEETTRSVGYIRLTRFSRASTAGYVKAISELEAAGAESYIIDLRNCYGGIVQEAMMTASTLLRDPHSVLCFTANSRGGLTPHDVEEFLVDRRFPGYFLSSEPSTVSLDQAKIEDPEYFKDGPSSWSPPSAYASLHEQGVKRNLHRSSGLVYLSENSGDEQDLVSLITAEQESTKRLSEKEQASLRAQKPIALLINEGTASSAEVFAAAIHDNGRAVALVGSQTYGKGAILHTFPMPDGGGLRISVAEYLTPALRHVTAPPLTQTGSGGISPDIECPSSQGIPSDTSADLCVALAVDVLDVAASIDN